MTNEQVVQLGIPISNFSYYYDADAERLYIDGSALEEGTWSSSDGATLFYPADVIKSSAFNFKNTDLVCEHLNLSIGKVTNIRLTDTGFAIQGAYITHKPSIKAVMSGDKRGLSIKANVIFDPVRRVVEKIWHEEHIALVASPACKVCGIQHAYTDQGIVIMSEEIVEGTQPVEDIVDESIDLDSVIMSDKDVIDPETGEIVKEEIEPSEVEVPIVEEVVETPPAEEVIPLVEVPVIDEITVTEATPPIETEVAMSSAPVEEIQHAASASPEDFTYTSELDEIKVTLSSATSTMASVSLALSEASTKLKEMEVSLSSTRAELASTKVELSTTKEELVGYKKTVDALQAQIKTTEEAERNKLISEIKGIDPEVDINFVTSMSTVQLSAYKSNIDRIASRGIAAGGRKSVKADEQVTLSAVETAPITRHDVASGIVTHLGKKQIAKNSRFGM